MQIVILFGTSSTMTSMKLFWKNILKKYFKNTIYILYFQISFENYFAHHCLPRGRIGLWYTIKWRYGETVIDWAYYYDIYI